MAAHLGDRAHLSHERRVALGTAGGIAYLKSWLNGRDVVVVNADTWSPGGLEHLLDGWDHERPRVLVAGGREFGPTAEIVASLLPWTEVGRLRPEPTGLYEVCWRHAHAEGRLDVVAHHGPVMDCGTPRRYLTANLMASGGSSVFHPSARVEGRVDRCVVWADGRVYPGEVLRSSIRARGPRGDVTVRVA